MNSISSARAFDEIRSRLCRGCLPETDSFYQTVYVIAERKMRRKARRRNIFSGILHGIAKLLPFSAKRDIITSNGRR